MPGLKFQKLIPVPVKNVRIKDAFWSPKLKIIREVTIPDVFTKFENDRGGALNNFDRVARGESGFHAGPPWYDGLIYESIRGAADFLSSDYDEKLDQRLDGYIERIAAAQAKDPDGYIHTWVTLLSPHTRWGKNGGDIVWQHDVYNAGCLIEAAVHHFRATRKINLLQIAVRFANYMSGLIGPAPKENIVPAHPLPEEALVKLYQLFRENPILRNEFSPAVDEAKYLALAKFWIDQRGHTEGRKAMGEYAQDHKPVLEHKEIVGHAVRACLLYTGLAAVAMGTGEKTYFDTVKRIWKNAVHRRMYLTGGVGAYQHEEKFGGDYVLPNDGYLETCAAVAMAFWHHNMNLAFGHAVYADELERAIYNGSLVGVSLAGNTYFYTNPMIAHDHNRWDWHGCPCCPPMILKLLGALPSYIYAYDKHSVYVNLFIGSSARIPIGNTSVKLHQETTYPWSGKIKIVIDETGQKNFPIQIRVPGWAKGNPASGDLYLFNDSINEKISCLVNGKSIRMGIKNGYLQIKREWKKGDTLVLTLPMPARQVISNPKVKDNIARTTLMSGPLVYCLEDADNRIGVDKFYLTHSQKLRTEFRPRLLKGVKVIQGIAEHKQIHADRIKLKDFIAVPYYAQNNRGPGAMSVWMPTGEQPVFVPEGTIFIDTQEVGISISFRSGSVYYTRDGTTPTLKSNRYLHPFKIRETTTVTARAFLKNGKRSEVVTARYEKVSPRPAENPAVAIPGILGMYYEGEWRTGIPDLETVSPLEQIYLRSINLDFTKRNDKFMVVFKGFINVIRTGIYGFYLKSEGPSSLLIGNSSLVYNEGSSGMKEMNGKIALEEGMHSVQIAYCQRGGGKVIEVHYEGPGVKKQLIPDSMIYSEQK